MKLNLSKTYLKYLTEMYTNNVIVLFTVVLTEYSLEMNLVDDVGNLLDPASTIFENYAEAYCTEVHLIHLNTTEILITNQQAHDVETKSY